MSGLVYGSGVGFYPIGVDPLMLLREPAVVIERHLGAGEKFRIAGRPVLAPLLAPLNVTDAQLWPASVGYRLTSRREVAKDFRDGSLET